MERMLKSYTIVPDEYYVERFADRQIVNVINDMGRPGYVLVARQMGKTNLLLHTKAKMQSDRNVFVYIDFSSIPVHDDTTFFDLLVRKTIEERKELFAEAKARIEKQRQERLFESVNRYTAELLILLEYVDKLVFVLDEIDALTRCRYSDNIFAQIRSDYFQRANYPALYKVTYVLSGVVEPKDLIKDPNISPFNIGEKIYIRSFSERETYQLISKLGLDMSEETIDRVYYWTNGHPRMLNDLCHNLQYIEKPTPDDVDETVRRYYLEAFDNAPIDSIRRHVANDPFLRDAVIQLMYSDDYLSADVKQKLYLEGIGDYQGLRFIVKNPIIKEAIPLEWLKSVIDKQDRDVLKNANKMIFMQKKYNDAIELLKKYVSLGEMDAVELNEAYYLLGLCYFRMYDTEESQRNLDKMNMRVGQEGQETIMNAYLIKGYNYSNLSRRGDCIRAYEEILEKKSTVNKELYAKAYIGKVDALLRGEKKDIQEGKRLMRTFLEDAEIEYYYGYRAVSYYELSAAEDALGNQEKALEYIEDAMQYAETGEMPTLLFNKLLLCEDEKQQNNTIERLLSYLKSYDRKPEIEDFDQMLNMNYSTLASIMAEIILYHEKYADMFEPFLRWFNNSDVAAYNSIAKYLRNFDDHRSLPFAKRILYLYEREGWQFGSDHIFNALAIIYKCDPNVENALTLYEHIEKNNYSDSRKEVARALIEVTKEFITTGRYDKAQRVVDFYRTQFATQKDTFVNALSVINDYYGVIIQIRRKDLDSANEQADIFIRKCESLTDADYELISPMSRSTVRRLRSDVGDMLAELNHELHSIQPITRGTKYGRNDKVTVVYFEDGRRITDKYKKLLPDIERGKCRIEDEFLW